MTVSLGLDIGSNSVGSAWVDTDKKEIVMGVSVFPAGVDESETKRGSPKNQHRREKRSQRKNLARRAARKHRLRHLLTSAGLLPSDPIQWKALVEMNPWTLRRKALAEPVTPHEFGRILVHLNQRRGALGVQTDPEDQEEGKVKEAIDHLASTMKDREAETFGQFMADLMDERKHLVAGKEGKFYHDPIRNRRDTFEFHATRDLIQKEFGLLWDKQKKFGGGPIDHPAVGGGGDPLRGSMPPEFPGDFPRRVGPVLAESRDPLGRVPPDRAVRRA